jgi:hypothetical protein
MTSWDPVEWPMITTFLIPALSSQTRRFVERLTVFFTNMIDQSTNLCHVDIETTSSIPIIRASPMRLDSTHQP